MKTILTIKRVAEQKIKSRICRQFYELENFHGRATDILNNEQVQDYQIYCIQEKELAWRCKAEEKEAIKQEYRESVQFFESNQQLPLVLKNILG